MNDGHLIQRYLDGRLSSEELEALQQRLREDAVLREHLREIAEQVVTFGDMARARSPAAELRALGGESTAESAEKRRGRVPWLALAASLAVLAASAWPFFVSQPGVVLTLVESTGTVAWSDGTVIASGERLPAGTLETIGEMSSALFQFADGSRITLHGDSWLSFADDVQKALTLAHGTLSAEVRPQAVGRPMLVHTPSAVAEVVGTVFDLTTRPEDTLLKVNEGVVKLKRLADGAQVDVSAKNSAVASLLTDAKLDSALTPEPLTGWIFDFTAHMPPREWRGFARDGRMNASPYVARKNTDGSVITLHGISVRTAMLGKPLRLLATETSVIRYRLRVEHPVPLHLMLLTNVPDGSFGGNYETHIQPSELIPDPDGWCEVSIPITRCRPVDKQRQNRQGSSSIAGKIITCAIINATHASHRLAVSRFELLPHP